jgi:hypothetical protein
MVECLQSEDENKASVSLKNRLTESTKPLFKEMQLVLLKMCNFTSKSISVWWTYLFINIRI